VNREKIFEKLIEKRDRLYKAYDSFLNELSDPLQSAIQGFRNASYKNFNITLDLLNKAKVSNNFNEFFFWENKCEKKLSWLDIGLKNAIARNGLQRVKQPEVYDAIMNDPPVRSAVDIKSRNAYLKNIYDTLQASSSPSPLEGTPNPLTPSPLIQSPSPFPIAPEALDFPEVSGSSRALTSPISNTRSYPPVVDVSQRSCVQEPSFGRNKKNSSFFLKPQITEKQRDRGKRLGL